MYARMNKEELELIFGIVIPNLDGCYGKGKDGITQKQKDFIHSLGINISGLKYKAQASVVIDCAMKRRQEGLASLKQIQTIRNLGVKTAKPIYKLTKTEASELLVRYL